MVSSGAVCVLCHIASEVYLSLFFNLGLRYVKSRGNLRRTVILEKRAE
jgi:hypothetical protein